ncbi:cbb3-type cytochrome oxidase subunit 3 [Aliikangiella marina]|uniref:cbb3-type cytochrome oxidase subunit 3 n=1 Tax=Aliikangiella marina TaxID=1712262 RepID=UPI001AEDE7B6|nr:cbb3-type cytochrome c oxidase subunit 3 [Aliikangiella marina]
MDADLNLIRSLTTLALFILFIVLIYKVYSKKGKKYFEDAANLPFEDGDERSEKVNQESKVKNND